MKLRSGRTIVFKRRVPEPREVKACAPAPVRLFLCIDLAVSLAILAAMSYTILTRIMDIDLTIAVI